MPVGAPLPEPALPAPYAECDPCTRCNLPALAAPAAMSALLPQAVIEGLDVQSDMDAVYALMGACPQHDLLWDGLTGGCPGGGFSGGMLQDGW